MSAAELLDTFGKGLKSSSNTSVSTGSSSTSTSSHPPPQILNVPPIQPPPPPPLPHILPPPPHPPTLQPPPHPPILKPPLSSESSLPDLSIPPPILSIPLPPPVTNITSQTSNRAFPSFPPPTTPPKPPLPVATSKAASSWWNPSQLPPIKMEHGVEIPSSSIPGLSENPGSNSYSWMSSGPYSQEWTDYNQFNHTVTVIDNSEEDDTDDRNWGEPPGNEELQALESTPIKDPSVSKPIVSQSGVFPLLPFMPMPVSGGMSHGNLREVGNSTVESGHSKNLVSIPTQAQQPDTDYRCYDYSALSEATSDKRKRSGSSNVYSKGDHDTRSRRHKSNTGDESGSDMDISASGSDDMDISDSENVVANKMSNSGKNDARKSSYVSGSSKNNLKDLYDKRRSESLREDRSSSGLIETEDTSNSVDFSDIENSIKSFRYSGRSSFEKDTSSGEKRKIDTQNSSDEDSVKKMKLDTGANSQSISTVHNRGWYNSFVEQKAESKGEKKAEEESPSKPIDSDSISNFIKSFSCRLGPAKPKPSINSDDEKDDENRTLVEETTNGIQKLVSNVREETSGYTPSITDALRESEMQDEYEDEETTVTTEEVFYENVCEDSFFDGTPNKSLQICLPENESDESDFNTTPQIGFRGRGAPLSNPRFPRGRGRAMGSGFRFEMSPTSPRGRGNFTRPPFSPRESTPAYANTGDSPNSWQGRGFTRARGSRGFDRGGRGGLDRGRGGLDRGRGFGRGRGTWNPRGMSGPMTPRGSRGSGPRGWSPRW